MSLGSTILLSLLSERSRNEEIWRVGRGNWEGSRHREGQQYQASFLWYKYLLSGDGQDNLALLREVRFEG